MMMRKMWCFVFLAITLALTSTTVFADFKVLVIPKGVKALFWNRVEEGARKAGKDLGVRVIVRGPSAEDQHNAQVHIIDYGISEDYDAVVLAPNHEEAAASALKRAVAKGMKVVLIDSGMTSAYHGSLIASDNYRAGQMAAEYIASVSGSSGNIILARHIRGHASTGQREQGFLDTISSRYPDMQVIADPYVGTSMGEAYRTIADLLHILPPVKAIFSVGEEATFGISRALSDGDLKKKIKFVGFDINPDIRKAIFNDEIDAVFLQNPYQMGYQGVMVAKQLIEKEKVDARIYTDIMLVTRENIETSQVQDIVRLYMMPQE